MSCNWENKSLCKTYKVYMAVGNPSYHGELCTGCLWWQDSPEDAAFKENIKRIVEKSNEREAY